MAEETAAGSEPQPENKVPLSRRFTRYFRLLVYADPTAVDLLVLVCGVLAAIASGVPFPLLGILFGQLVDDLNTSTCEAGTGDPADYQAAVNDKILTVVYIAIAYFVLVYICVGCWNLTGERLAQRLRERYLRSILRQDVSFFDNLPAGEAASRLTGDIATIQGGTSEKVGVVLNTTSFFVTAYIVAFIKNAKLAGMLVSVTPAYLIMSLVGGYYVQKYSGKMMEHVATASSTALEALSNTTVVHAFTANFRLEEKFAKSLQIARGAGIKKAIASAAQAGLLFFIAYSANALAFWQGSRTIADATETGGSGTTVGTTYTVIFILLDASMLLSQTAPFLQVFDAAAAAFEKLEAAIERESKIDGTVEGVGRTLPEVSGHVELQNVSFEYPSRPDVPVLRDVSLTCPAGKHTALVGLSGSGKSTVAGMVTRLYDPNHGAVLLDGHDIRELNVKFLRSNIGLIGQDSVLFDRSILENIALGLVNSPAHAHLESVLGSSQLAETAEAVRNGKNLMDAARERGEHVIEIVTLAQEAAAVADAAGFIGRLKDGFGTMVGSSGNLISGGQKQRIALARALVKSPKILILDEATASLDSASERRVQAAIEKVAMGRTLITIAHRLSTIRNADNIIVMRNGRIIEQGPHAELMERNGAYADLVRLQNLNVRPDEEVASDESTADDTGGVSVNSVERSQFGSDEILDEKKAVAAETTEEEKKAADESNEALAKKSLWEVSMFLGTMFRPYILFLLVAFVGAVVVGGTYCAAAVIFGNTVGELSPCNEADDIRSAGRFYGLMFFVLAIAEFFANLASWSLFGYAAEKIIYKIRVLSFRALLEQDKQWHQSDGRSPLSLQSLITKDGNSISGLTGSVVGTVMSISVNLIAAIILSHVVAWKIALVCLAVVPLMLGAGVMRFISAARFEARHAAAYAKSLGIAVEAVNSIKTVTSLSLEHEVLGTYIRSLEAPNREMAKQSAWTNLWLAISYGLGNFIYALAYWWGSKRVISGDYSQKQFFIVLLALLVSAQLWGHMFALAPDISRAFSAAGKILGILELGSTKKFSRSAKSLELGKGDKSAVDIEATAETREKTASGDRRGISVEFKGVEFSYPSRPDVKILHGLDLRVEAGQFAALVGPSGAGKSTIISLVERMYTPSAGAIEINGVDITRRTSVSFRDDIALVPQDNVLFEGSIRFNVALGARPGQDVTDAEIEEACRIANIHDTVASLPQGYDTPCGPNSGQLSGGQKQRLAIARALVRKPRLLLLDESTSALDAESERLLQDGLEKATRDTTVIAIAHRLHTIRKADVIFLIEDGRCVDRGTHAELSERSESYRMNALHQAVDADGPRGAE
ncbi:hypothetical protein VTO42DRAFT_1724 [Malbranchea cinnamomea]